MFEHLNEIPKCRTDERLEFHGTKRLSPFPAHISFNQLVVHEDVFQASPCVYQSSSHEVSMAGVHSLQKLKVTDH